MLPYCQEKGIYLRTTATYTPEENGVAERSNRTVKEKARALLIEANLPIKFWLYAVLSAVYLMNRTISSSLPHGKTPYEMIRGWEPDLTHMRTFGCLCYALIQKELRRGVFSEVSRPSILIGHTEHNHNYIVYVIESSTIVTSHNIAFQEHTFPFRKMKTFDIGHLSFDDDEVEPLPDPTVPAPPQSTEQDDYVGRSGGVGMHQDPTHKDQPSSPPIEELPFNDPTAESDDNAIQEPPDLR